MKTWKWPFSEEHCCVQGAFIFNPIVPQDQEKKEGKMEQIKNLLLLILHCEWTRVMITQG